MNRDEFEHGLARYGADFARWPAAEASAGEALAASDKAAAASLAVARALDQLLARAVSPVRVDAATVGRIVSGISARHEREMTVKPTGRLLAWAGAAMAVFLVAGFVLGVTLPQPNDDDDALAGMMFGNSFGTSVDGGGIL